MAEKKAEAETKRDEPGLYESDPKSGDEHVHEPEHEPEDYREHKVEPEDDAESEPEDEDERNHQSEPDDDEPEVHFEMDAKAEKLAKRWDKVSFVLQDHVSSSRHFAKVRAISSSSMQLFEEIEKVAAEHNMLKGKIARMLLPYNENTSVDDQKAVDPSTSPLVDIMSIDQIEHLVNAAGNLRQLIRVKVADCGDLDQAKEAIKELLKFFKRPTRTLPRSVPISSI